MCVGVWGGGYEQAVVIIFSFFLPFLFFALSPVQPLKRLLTERGYDLKESRGFDSMLIRDIKVHMKLSFICCPDFYDSL